MNKVFVIKLFTVLMILSLIIGNMYVYGFGNGFDPSVVPAENSSQKLNNVNTAFGKVFNTVILILQVLSVGGIIFAGVKIMFTTNSADRADMFESMKFLIIGMVIVFGASSIIQFIVKVAIQAIE